MKRTIKLTESDLHRVIKESVKGVLNEISKEKMARAYVGAGVDLDNLNGSNDSVATNGIGRNVHRDSQKKRRERQMNTFRRGLSNELSKELGRNVDITRSGNNNNTRYYGQMSRSRSGDNPIYWHYASVDGYDPTDVYRDNDGRTLLGNHDMDSAHTIADLTDAMAGYHDELTGGKYSQANLDALHDRFNDVENLNKYRQDLEDYEERANANKREIDDFDRKPWYRKIGKRAPAKMTEPRPEPPKLKTGPYFMPNDTDGLTNAIEKTKGTIQKNRDAYHRRLK